VKFSVLHHFKFSKPMMTESQCRALVRHGIERGWIQLRKPMLKPGDDERKAALRMCMARLRAERRGQDTSMFPPRVRKKPKLHVKKNKSESKRIFSNR
jgi:hypothetical protein